MYVRMNLCLTYASQQFNDELREGEVLGGGFHFSF